MKFLLDENADIRLAPWLRSQGHDVTVVAHDYPYGLADGDVLSAAHREQRILITNDRDFGALIVREGHAHAGVVYFRLSTVDLPTLTLRLTAVLTDYADQFHEFLVVTDERVRVRRGGEEGE